MMNVCRHPCIALVLVWAYWEGLVVGEDLEKHYEKFTSFLLLIFL